MATGMAFEDLKSVQKGQQNELEHYQKRTYTICVNTTYYPRWYVTICFYMICINKCTMQCILHLKHRNLRLKSLLKLAKLLKNF